MIIIILFSSLSDSLKIIFRLDSIAYRFENKYILQRYSF